MFPILKGFSMYKIYLSKYGLEFLRNPELLKIDLTPFEKKNQKNKNHQFVDIV